MQDAFGVDRALVSKADRSKRAAIIGGSAVGGAALGQAPYAGLIGATRGSLGYGPKGKHSVNFPKQAALGAAKGVGGAYNPMEWARAGKASPKMLGLLALPAAGAATAGGVAAYKTRKKEPVTKYDKSHAAIGGVVGTATGAGAVAGSRTLWNADHLPTKALNAPEQALRRGRHPGPMVRDHFAVSGKGRAESVYRMLGDAKPPSRLEGMARHIPKGAGRLGLLSNPKAAGVAVGTGVVVGGGAGLIHRRNKDAKVHL